MAERRIAQRARTFWKGTILFPGGLRSVECTVRNFSATGARLDCGAVPDIPDHFDLKIPQKGGTFPCKVAWRRPPEVGVEFLAAETTTEGSLLAQKVKVLEIQNRKLMRKLHDDESNWD